MKIRIPILFLTLLLLLAVFGAGTAAADTQFEDYFEKNVNDQILGYNELIYVNGDTVTIVNNFETSSFPVRKFNEMTYGSASSIPAEFKYDIDTQNQKTTVQFNVSELGLRLTENDERYEDFTVYLCGNVGGEYGNKHVDSEIRFRAEKIFEESEEPENGDEENPVTPAYEIIVYPIQNGFTHDFNIAPYYSTEYGSVFEDETVYPDLKKELVAQNVIYCFDRGNLRFIQWYPSEAEELNFEPAVSLGGYKPEFILNLSELQAFYLNSVFICPEHDTFNISEYGNNGSKKFLSVDGLPFSDCSSDIGWGVSIGGSEKEASDYLMTYQDLYPAEEEDEMVDPEKDPASPEDGEPEEETDVIIYPHFVSFNSSALSGDLSKKRTQEIQFYPVLKAENGLEPQPGEPGKPNPTLPDEEEDENDDVFTSFIDQAYTFKFSRLYKSVPIELTGDTLELVSETTDYKKPLVSSLSFPEKVQSALKDNALIIENLNANALEDVEDNSGYLTPETSVLSVTDISFEKSINDILAENNESVELSFVIPTVLDGIELHPDEIAVLHISDDGEKKSLDKLEAAVRLKEINGVKYYAVTAKTSGFSPFAVISTENRGSETVSKAGSPLGEAVVVPPEEAVPAGDKNGFGNDLLPLIIIEDIITKVQGHLSVFSVLVVLTSGLFMWSYIRRRI